VLRGATHNLAQPASGTITLRLASAVILFFASLAGIAPPLVYRSIALEGHGALAAQLKAFGCGIVLSLALLHLVADSFERLSDLSEFPWAGVCVCVGMLFMFFMDAYPRSVATRPKGNGGHKGNGGSEPCASELEEAGHGVGDSEQAAHVVGGHSHSHGSLLLQAPRTDKLLTAYLLEASILCHSLIIGADLGVSTGNAQKVAGLTAVLAVHQFFEGIGLGTVIADAGAALPPQKKIAFCLAFCCTTSVGVILGRLFTAPGPRGGVLAGILDGVTGGMLLQLSFGPIVADEFARPDLPAHVKVNMFGLIALGAFSMAVLAIWA